LIDSLIDYFNKFRHRFVIFEKNHPDNSLYSKTENSVQILSERFMSLTKLCLNLLKAMPRILYSILLDMVYIASHLHLCWILETKQLTVNTSVLHPHLCYTNRNFR